MMLAHERMGVVAKTGADSTFDSISIAQRVQCVFTGESVGGDIGNHDCAGLLPNERVSQHLRCQQ